MEENQVANNPTGPTPEQLKALEEYLLKDRGEWEGRLIKLVKQVKDVELLAETQVDMLSFRQMITEKITQVNIRNRKLKATYDRHYKTLFVRYFNWDYKLNHKQQDSFVDADLAPIRVQIGLLEAQIDFFKSSVDTLDKMSWAIANRIKIDEI